MFLSDQAIRWAISHLRANCHPFLGITFLAAKRAKLPVGDTIETSLDALTRDFLRDHHSLDGDSEHFFQPFKSVQNWVSSRYPSSGLQAINTQTFSSAFIHPKKSRSWGFASDYVERIYEKLDDSSSSVKTFELALAIWTGKSVEWPTDIDADRVIARFRENFFITTAEVERLFSHAVVSDIPVPLFQPEMPDLKVISHSYGLPPDAPDQTEGLLASMRLEHIGPASRFDLEFGERLTLVAGDNGLGKSFLLDTAWWAITGIWAGSPAYPFIEQRSSQPTISYVIKGKAGNEIECSSAFDWTRNSWVTTGDRPSVAALCIYAKVDGSFAVADEIRGRLKVGTSPALSSFTSREVWDGKPGQIEGLVRDWVSWQTSDPAAFSLLSRLLEHLSPDDLGNIVPDEPVRLPGDPRRIPTISHLYGVVPILYASAGVQRILLLAYLIIWSWQEHKIAAEQAQCDPHNKMVIVIDELEAHLHPKWQRLVLPALLTVGKLLSDELELQIITATHSPMVLASIETEFSPDADVLAHLQLAGENVELEPLDFYKYGEISDWLTSPVFGLTHARSRRAERAIETAKALQLSASPSVADVKAAHNDLLRALSPDDRFWSRWLFFAENFGIEE